MGACLSSPHDKDAGSRSFQSVVSESPSGGGTMSSRTTCLAQSNLIFALDFTKSNRSNSFGRIQLHSLGEEPNPYEQVITSITHAVHDAVNRQEAPIHAMGFGDFMTQDMSVFSFYNGDVPAPGLDALLIRYRELVPCVKASNLTSFAPAIYQGMRFVVDSGCKHHTLVIITSSWITHPPDLAPEQCGRQELATVNAIVAASELPLSIVVVGLGDKSVDGMQRLQEKLPERRWENFHFVQFPAVEGPKTEAALAAFAVQALENVPAQLKTVHKLGLVGCPVAMDSNVRSLPPPTIPLEPTAKGSLLVSDPSGGSDATASSVVSQQQQGKAATAFERWADTAQAPGKTSAAQGLIFPRAPGPGPSPFSAWVSNNMPRAPQNMEHQPDIGIAPFSPGGQHTQHAPYNMPPNSMDMMSPGHYGQGGDGSGYGLPPGMMQMGPMGMMPPDAMHHGMGQQGPPMGMMQPDPMHHGMQQQVPPMGMLQTDAMHHGMGQQLGPMGMLPPDAMHHPMQQQGPPMGMLMPDPMHHGMARQLPPMGMMPPDAMHHGMPQQQSALGMLQPDAMHHGMGQQQSAMGMPALEMHHGIPQQMPMQAGMSNNTGTPADDDFYVDPQFICPLGGKIMREPVMACDGHTYDRENISEWLRTHDTSPTTQQVLLHKELVPDHQLKASIAEFVAGMNQQSGRRYLP